MTLSPQFSQECHTVLALADLIQEQFTREQLTTLRNAGMRYRGQSYEVSVPVTELNNDADLVALGKRFHEAHRRRYGHMAESEAVEIVNFQVTAVGAIPKPQFSPIAPPADSQPPIPHEMRTAYFSPAAATQVPVFRRSALAAGAAIDGPAVIEAPPGLQGILDDFWQRPICSDGAKVVESVS